MPGFFSRDRVQREWSNPALFTSSRDPPSSHYRTRSTSHTRHLEARSRSPQRSRASSPASSRFPRLSTNTPRHASTCNSTRQSSTRDSLHSTTGSSSHAHRSEGGHYYGSSEWSSQHGNRPGSVWSSVPSTAAVHRRNHREAPHLYGDDELPIYTTASQNNRDPQQPPSYSSSRNSAWQDGSMPPPYRSVSSRQQGDGGQRSESPAQYPPTRRPFQFYSQGKVSDRNLYIDKWRRGE